LFERRSSKVHSLSSAVKWYEAAAIQKSSLAYSKLAELYYTGKGVKADSSTALRYWFAAAEAGEVKAQTKVASLYQKGELVEKNDSEALRWYQLAAEQGDANAQRNLGVMYEFGTAGAARLDQAVKWYELAAAQGDLQAKLYLGELTKKVSSNFDALKAISAESETEKIGEQVYNGIRSTDSSPKPLSVDAKQTAPQQ